MKSASRPSTAWLAVLLCSASCAATGVRSAPTGIDDATSAHERQIDRSEFKFQWPFAIGTGRLSCESGAVMFHVADVTYGLNADARRRGFPSPEPILMTQRRPPTNPLLRLTQSDRERAFSTALGCDGARAPSECRSRVRERYRLSEAELDQVVTEGRERQWPPLPPATMSVAPIVEAGLRLCQ